MKPLAVDALKPLRSLTMEVPIAIRNTWRLKLGAWMLRLAGRVLICPVIVDMGCRDDVPPESP